MAKLEEKYEKRPSFPITKHGDGTYRMPSMALNDGKPWYLYRVQKGDSWVSVSSADGWSNAWDFIHANLNTRDPLEVNWYLREYIGCQELSNDQHNYSFTGAKNGLIWTRTPLATKHLVNMPGMVVNALMFKPIEVIVDGRLVHHPGRSFFNFQLNGYCLEPWMLEKARGAVAGGLVGVVHNSKLNADGVYYPGCNMMHFKSTSNSTENKGLMVHECVHLALDITRATGISRAVSEGLAYIAQCVYCQLYSSSMPSGEADEALIFSEANDIAVNIIDQAMKALMRNDQPGRYRVPAESAGSLISAITSSGRYRNSEHQHMDEYDGVRDRHGELI